MSETPINHDTNINIGAAHCVCGAILVRPISIREGVCQSCRNERARKVPGYGK